MDNPFGFLALGVIIGAIGALIVVGTFLWLRSSSAKEAQPASEPSQAHDKSIRLVPISVGEWMVETGGKHYTRLSEVDEALVAQRIKDMLEGLGRFAGRPVAVAPAPADPIPSPAPEPDMDELLRVWHPRTESGLVIEFRGQRYRRLAEVKDETTGRELLSVLGTLAAFSKGISVRARPSPEPVAAAPSPPPAVEEEFLRSLKAPPPPPPSKRGKQSAPPQPEILGIAGHIEEVLQRRLERTPGMVTRNIHVGSAADGTLRVEVDGRFYRGIDEVPDPAVREIIQAAVREWEAKI